MVDALRISSSVVGSSRIGSFDFAINGYHSEESQSFGMNKKTPEGAYAGCVGIERITGMLDGNGKLSSVCNKCVQERRKQNLHQYYHHIC